MRRGTRGGMLRAGLLAALLLLAIPAVASAVGISLNRTPAPPQAIQRGAGTETVEFAMTYETVADRVAATFTDPSGLDRAAAGPDRRPGQPSPVNGKRQFSPGRGRPHRPLQGDGQLLLGSRPASIEASALVVFDVADSLGTLQLVKFEDVNGDGVRQAGRARRARLGRSASRTRRATPASPSTGSDGTVTIPSVPAGVWQVAEVIDPMWAAITPATGHRHGSGRRHRHLHRRQRAARADQRRGLHRHQRQRHPRRRRGRPAGRAPGPGRHAPRRHHRRGAGHALRQRRQLQLPQPPPRHLHGGDAGPGRPHRHHAAHDRRHQDHLGPGQPEQQLRPEQRGRGHRGRPAPGHRASTSPARPPPGADRRSPTPSRCATAAGSPRTTSW